MGDIGVIDYFGPIAVMSGSILIFSAAYLMKKKDDNILKVISVLMVICSLLLFYSGYQSHQRVEEIKNEFYTYSYYSYQIAIFPSNDSEYQLLIPVLNNNFSLSGSDIFGNCSFSINQSAENSYLEIKGTGAAFFQKEASSGGYLDYLDSGFYKWSEEPNEIYLEIQTNIQGPDWVYQDYYGEYLIDGWSLPSDYQEN